MEYVWSPEVDAILSVGRSMEEIGSKERALTRNEMLDALAKLRSIGIGVKGISVCSETNGRIDYNYDSWICERIDGVTPDTNLENIKNFVDISIDSAMKYIQNYPKSDSIFFSMVPYIKK